MGNQASGCGFAERNRVDNCGLRPVYSADLRKRAMGLWSKKKFEASCCAHETVRIVSVNR